MITSSTPLYNAIIIYVILVIILMILKPPIFYNDDKTRLRPFGIDDGETLLSFGAVVITCGILIYFIFLAIWVLRLKAPA